MKPIVVLLACLVLVSCAPTPPTDPQTLAQQLLIVDTHIDVPFRLRNRPDDVAQATETGNFDYPRAKAGGLDALFMSIYIPATVDASGDAASLADELIDSVEALVADAPDKFAIATCAADIDDIKSRGLIAFPLGMENGGPIAGSFDNLRHFYDRGIRYVTLTHSNVNHISDSSYDPFKRWKGLSPFGKTLIAEMNRLGVMVDVSHVSDATFWQVIELSKAPVIASHSSLRHFTSGFERNLTDEMVTALGENGGVVQINFGTGFLTEAGQQYRTQSRKDALAYTFTHQLEPGDPDLISFLADYRLAHPYPFATVDDVLDHFDRAVQLAGIDHVGIGSDYDGVGDSLPTGLKDVSQYPNLVAGFLERGYDNEAIAKLLGGNLMRVWRAVEAVAAQQGNAPQCST